MLAATFSDYLNTLKKTSAQRIFKVQVLDKNENIIDELSSSIIGGDIQLSDDSGSRRTASVSFENTKQNLFPSPDGYFWMNRKFRIWTGLKVKNEDYYISRGIFVCSEPEISSDIADNTISVQLLDKWNLLNGTLGGTLDITYTIPVGLSIEAAVRMVLSAAGEVKPPIIHPTDVVLPYALIGEMGSNYGELLVKLADMLSWTCYFDKDGYFRFEPANSLQATGSSWDFSKEEIHYLNSRHRYEFSKVFNYVLVAGENINGLTVQATASDTNSNSPTSIAKIGKKTLVINDSLISTTSLAQTRANAELIKAISLVETTDISSIPIDFLEGGDIITITDESSNLNGDRFLIKSISFPLMVDGDMSISAWKGRNLDD